MSVGLFIRVLLVLATLAGVVPALLMSDIHPFHVITPGNGGWRFVVAALLIWATLKVGNRLAERFCQMSFTTWWDPAKTADGNLDWDHLLLLVQPVTDPIDNFGMVRPRAIFSQGIVVVLGGAALFACARIAADWLALPELPAFLTLGGNKRLDLDALINLSGNLTAFLALAAAAASIWFANDQLRAKVRADNRQEWLASARTLLGEVVALAREHATADVKSREAFNRELDPRRLRFELMLNPREKDHRLLMHLLRRLAFIHEPTRAETADGGAFWTVLMSHCARRSVELGECDDGVKYYEAVWKPIVECTDPGSLTTYVMRLGHVVLKREWERVKAAR
ncbi:hypothetical protein V3I01_06275 [Sphingomonas sp. gentR]|jgi:hypothetical protein|uniref:hypothetical protein n=1 Tax=unclassified Sphingomonas TaxID=196159 RepID=UPI0012EB5EB3|nr:hypothetical protein [Sphingomonas sp. LK11]